MKLMGFAAPKSLAACEQFGLLQGRDVRMVWRGWRSRVLGFTMNLWPVIERELCAESRHAYPHWFRLQRDWVGRRLALNQTEGG